MLLKADRIELEILNLVVGTGPEGRSFGLPDLESLIQNKVGGVEQAEIVDALLDMNKRGILRLGKYNGGTLCDYDPSSSRSEFFYPDQFTCVAEPQARRRHQELSSNNRNGVFISHISEDKPIAFRLKQLLGQALGDVPIFVSSDHTSIPGGASWWKVVLEGLTRSHVVLLLLSKASMDRRWINFEAGVGMGLGSRVIPVVIRGLSKSDIGLPLGQLQARDLRIHAEVEALIAETGKALHLDAASAGVGQFVAELPEVEALTPGVRLDVIVCGFEAAVCLRIRNLGTLPLNLIEAELLVPSEMARRSLESFGDTAPVRYRKSHAENEKSWVGYRITTLADPRPYGITPLPRTVLKEMGEINLDGLRISFSQRLTAFDPSFVIRFRVTALEGTVHGEVRLSEINRES